LDFVTLFRLLLARPVNANSKQEELEFHHSLPSPCFTFQHPAKKKKLPGHDYMSGFGINWDCEVGVIASICACITTYGRLLISLWCGFVGIESNLVEYSYVWYWHCLMLDWYGAA
jgi:hypothetical protein